MNTVEFDLDKISFQTDMLTLSNDDDMDINQAYLKIKKIASTKRKQYERRNNSLFYKYHEKILDFSTLIYIGANEYINTGCIELKGLTQTGLNLVVTNILFKNDEEFIKFLLSLGITYDRANSLSQSIQKLGIVQETRSKERFKMIYKSTKIESELMKIRERALKYYGISDINAIINKINEILVFCPELYIARTKLANEQKNYQKRLHN